MKFTTRSRILAWLLTVAMVLTLVPTMAFAVESASYTKITTMDELVTGEYVMVLDNGYAPDVLEGTWVLPHQPTITETAITGSSWTVTVTEGGVKLTDSNGATIGPKGGNANGITAADYEWAVSCTDGKFQFAGVGADTVKLACNTTTAGSAAGNYRFRGYKTTTISGNPATYPCDFNLYKIGAGSGETPTEPTPTEPTPTEPTPTEPTPTEPTPTEPEAEYVPISTALAGVDGETFTVKGVVTLLDGQNVYVQDETGGICVRMTARPEDIALGDTIIGTGARAVYRGMVQLANGTYTKSSGLLLTAKETTIDALTEADVCTYVYILGLEVTEMYDNNGAYTSPNVTVTDGTNSIQIYKAVVDKDESGAWAIQVGDVINVKAAVGTNNGTLQLRNTLASEITKAAELPTDPTEPQPTEPEPTEPEPTEPEAEYVPISTALAGNDGETFTVKGVVTLLDGQNVYVQDETGGICVRMTARPEDIALGDTIIGTGARAVYRGMVQLANGTYTKSSGLVLTAKPVQISELTVADVCTYVKLSGVEVTEIYDNNGAYSSPNVTVTDGTFSIQIYKAAVAKNEDGTWAIQVGDKIDVKAAVGINNETLQLRNTLTSEITKARENGIVTDLSTLQDGDTVVVFNPAHMKALSTTYKGYYNLGTDVTLRDGTLYGYTEAEIWTLGINEDGTYTFSTADGKKIAMAASRTSMPLDEVNSTWKITAAATADCVYIENAVRSGYRMEFQDSYGTWSAYNKIGDLEILFAQQIYLVVDGGAGSTPGGDTITEGDMVMLYNLSAEGVLALQDGNAADPTSCVIRSAAATIEDDGKVTAANGGLVFKIEANGEYYRFYNETFGYLCSTGTGNNAFYSLEASDDADWKVTSGKSGGYFLESRTAKFNGQHSQYLEYYGESYKSYSMYNVTDYDIYEFFFYPCGNEQLTGGVVNEPMFVYGEMDNAYIGKAYTFQFTVDAVFGVDTVSANFDFVVDEYDTYTVTIPVEDVTGESLTILLNGKDTVGVEFASEIVVPIRDEPIIDEVTPAPNYQTGEEKRPVISAKLINVGENPTVVMTVNEEEVAATYADGVVSYTPAADMADDRVAVTLTVIRADGKTATKTWSFTVGKASFQLYFGQLHSHTTYSDGSGDLKTALNYIAGLDESANVDFVAFTDHSNYFDSKTAINPEGALYDMTLGTADSQKLWAEYKGTVAEFNASQNKVVAIAGFEMTWSGGPGHINTFVTPGIVSRNNTTLNNKTNDAGMKAYYALLSQAEGADSISQFNHPGNTFGTFTDFSYWDAVLDNRMYLVEVGNGEGQVGAGGYFPSYEYYTMALDKGWHLAPTNNQDNHKGKWGNANDARDVILTDNFTEEGLYEAIRQYRVYSTEDKNLEIRYTVNDMVMGSIISEIPETLNLNVQVYDPDKNDSISKVEVIVNSGKVAYTWDNASALSGGELTCTLAPDYSYYYIRVTEGDGEIAVTAPVWVGETLKLGVSSVVCGTAIPVTDEELTITTTLFNSEAVEATVKSITYTTNGSTVLYSDDTVRTIPASGTLAIDWAYTPTEAKVMKITATVVVEMEGIEYEFSMDVELDVVDASKLVYLGIDASHYNEYVAGNYKDSMGNFSQLAGGYNVRTVELKTSEDLIAACGNEKFVGIILTAPSRRLADAQADPRVYSDAELAALKAFNEAGGAIILAGWSDNYENYPVITGNPDIVHMAETQNTILEALGSSLRITDDATHDDTYNGGQTQRLYFNSYNFDSFLVDRVEVDPENPHDRMYTEVYSQYGGATIHVVDATGTPTSTVPATVTPIVFGHAGTYSKDTDNDGIGGASVPKYTYAEGDDRLLVLASEELEGKGMIIVSGAAFMSNFEVQATIEDSVAEKNYSNYKICENLIQYLNPVQVTPIAEVAAQTEVGYKYTIEGVVTSNASGYDKDTAFFDCIYVQDATGGICCFPVAGNYKIGDVVRVTGTTEFYQGEAELQVTSITVIGESEPVAPTTITAAQLNNREVEGMLVSVSGIVKSYEIANGLIQTIMVEDAEGNVARVFIDGYITTANEVKDIQVGCLITATGLASYDDTFNAPEGPFPRIRVRNRADIVCTENPNYKPELPFEDVGENRWFYPYVEYVFMRGLMTGMSETKFGPDNKLDRAQIVTILYRMAGSPKVEGENPFEDVPAGKYYTDAVIWASSNGITNGKTATLFMPKQNVNRQELVTFLYRYAQFMGADMSVDPSITIDGFADAHTVSGFAVEAMTWAYANELVGGMGNNKIAPKDTATRAQVAKLITVLDQLLNG